MKNRPCHWMGDRCKKLWPILLSRTLALDAEEQYEAKNKVFLLNISRMLTRHALHLKDDWVILYGTIHLRLSSVKIFPGKSTNAFYLVVARKSFDFPDSKNINLFSSFPCSSPFPQPPHSPVHLMHFIKACHWLSLTWFLWMVMKSAINLLLYLKWNKKLIGL